MKTIEQFARVQDWHDKVVQRHQENPTDPLVLVQMGALAIYRGSETEATNYLTAAEALPDHSPHFARRILCIQSQMAAREGKVGTARRLLHAAHDISNNDASGTIILRATQKELGIAERRFRV